MDNSKMSDDEIELLNLPAGEERSVENEDHNGDFFVNPFHLLHRGPSEEESINPASHHALQTALSSIQQKLNDKSKKYNELLQKNKLMQKALFDMSKQAGGMDDLCPQEPSIVHAAGAGAGSGCSSEDEAAIAERRAKQGYISHLEKEVLRKTSALARANEEIQRLKRKLDDQEREKKTFLQTMEKLQMDNEFLSRGSEEKVRQTQTRIEELEKHHKNLCQENLSLKEQISALDRNNPKEAELRDLKTKLTVAETEMTKLTIQYRELDRKMKEKDDELLRLQSKCKQYDIEADINRKRKIAEGSDELDGDTDILMKALDMIQSQRSEVTSLLSHVQQQKSVIKELMEKNENDWKPVCKCHPTIREERGMAQGASINVQFEEQGYQRASGSRALNAQCVQEQVSSQVGREDVPLARRQSDRRDYRGVNKQSSKPPSPRVTENFLPTGSIHIPEMLANEDTHLPRRPVGDNVFDNIGTSRQPHLSPRSFAQSPQPLYMNITSSQGASSQRQDSQAPERVKSPQNSPRPVNNLYQNIETPVQFPSQQDFLNVNNGARPKRNYMQDNYLPQHYHEAEGLPNKRLPDRMTQSAILLRDESDPDDRTMSRSMFSPNLVLQGNAVECSDVYQTTQQDQSANQIKPHDDSVYRKNVRALDNGPDYENILNIKPEPSSRRPVEEHEEILSGIDNQTANNVSQSCGTRQANSEEDMNTQTEENEVSALKICPVCNLEFSRMTMDQFQTHVFECFDNCEEPQTMQPTVAAAEDDRNCPMCGEVFPMAIPQETFEQHVLAHFGEEPMVERFEMLN